MLASHMIFDETKKVNGRQKRPPIGSALRTQATLSLCKLPTNGDKSKLNAALHIYVSKIG